MTIVLLGAAVKWLMRSNAILEERIEQIEKNKEAKVGVFESQDAQTSCEEKRSVCTQSMCTYNRRLTQPRFVVLAERETEPVIVEEIRA